MPAADDPGKPGPLPADHAGSVLCRLLISHPDVIDIEISGIGTLTNTVVAEGDDLTTAGAVAGSRRERTMR